MSQFRFADEPDAPETAPAQPEPTPVESAPAESAPVEPAPVEAAPKESAPEFSIAASESSAGATTPAALAVPAPAKSGAAFSFVEAEPEPAPKATPKPAAKPAAPVLETPKSQATPATSTPATVAPIPAKPQTPVAPSPTAPVPTAPVAPQGASGSNPIPNPRGPNRNAPLQVPKPVAAAPTAPTPSVAPPSAPAKPQAAPNAAQNPNAPRAGGTPAHPPQQPVPNVAVKHPPAPPQPNPTNRPATNAAAKTTPGATVKAAPQAPQIPTTPPVVNVANIPTAPGATAYAQTSGATPGMATVSQDVTFQKAGVPWRKYQDTIEPIVFWAFRMSAVVAALSLLYMLFAIFGGGAGTPPTDAASAQRAQLFANDLSVVARVFHWSLLIAMFSMAMMLAEEKWVGPVLAVVGVLLHFGAPLAMKAVGQTPATATVALILRGTGMALLVVGLLRYGVDLFRWFTELPQRMKARATVGNPQKAEAAQQRIAAHATMFSPCWSLPFCREVIRQQCPAFLARKRCWKFGRGCYCDEEMIARIIRGESIEKIKAPTRQSQSKPPCGRCHIYLEHQGLKYKMLSPLAVPLTGAVMFFGWPLYTLVFNGFADRLDSLWARLSFDPKAFTPQAVRAAEGVETGKPNDAFGSMTPDEMQQYALVMFGVIAGFFVLIYVSKAIEWAILKAKL